MDLVPQFSTKKALLGLIRKRKENCTIAFKHFLNFDFIVEISNFEVNKKASKTFSRVFSDLPVLRNEIQKKL